jgi:hypothetical protein
MATPRWAGPLSGSADLSGGKFYGEETFEAASEEAAISRASELYGAAFWGLTVEVGRDRDEMVKATEDIQARRSKVIKIYRKD